MFCYVQFNSLRLKLITNQFCFQKDGETQKQMVKVKNTSKINERL